MFLEILTDSELCTGKVPMVHIIKLSIFWASLLSISFSTFAQSTGGSPYSYYEIGNISESDVGMNRTLGGTGIALRDSFNLNLRNPASYNSIIRGFSQITSAGLSISSSSLSDGNDSYRNTEFQIDQVALWFRIFRKSGLVLGLAPYSKVNYNIFTTNTLSGLPGEYKVNYTGNGGLTSFYTGTSIELFNNFTAGLNISYLFGSINQDLDLQAEDYGFNYQLSKQTFLRSFLFDFGVQYSLKIHSYTLILGGIYQIQKKLKGNFTYEVSSGDELIYESTEGVDKYYLPESYGWGIGIPIPKRWMLTFDYARENWSSIPHRSGYNLRDSERYALGMMLQPKWNSLEYIDRIGWGMGGFYKKTYLVLNNQGIDDYGFSLGIRIPAGKQTMLDFTYDNSFKAYQTERLIQENKHTVSIHLNLFDVWFNRQKYR